MLQAARLRFIGAAGRAERLHLRQTKIQNLGVSAFGDKNVRRLDVAMHDPPGMRRVQRIGNLDGQRQQAIHSERTAPDTVLQRHALKEFHGDESLSTLLADVVNRANIGMV